MKKKLLVYLVCLALLSIGANAFTDNCNSPSGSVWNVTNDTYCINQTLCLSHDVIINTGYTLYLINSTIYMDMFQNIFMYINGFLYLDTDSFIYSTGTVCVSPELIDDSVEVLLLMSGIAVAGYIIFFRRRKKKIVKGEKHEPNR